MFVQTHTFKFKPMLTAVIVNGKPFFIVNDIADMLDVSSTYINANVPDIHLLQLNGREHIAKIKKIDSCVYRINLIDKDGIFYLGNHFNKRIISHLTNPLIEFINSTVNPTAKKMFKIETEKRRKEKKKEVEPKTEQKDLFKDERMDIMEDRIESLERTVETQGEQIKFLLDELGVVYKKDNEKTIKALVDTLGLTVDQAQQLAQIGESIRKQGVK